MLSASSRFITVRSLIRTPIYFGVALLTVLLSVGFAVGVWQLVDAAFVADLPYPEPDALVSVERQQGAFSGPVSAPLFEDWKAQSLNGPAELAGFFEGRALISRGTFSWRAPVARVGAEFWAVMMLRPQLGRVFDASEEKTGKRLALISAQTWKREFGERQDVLGQVLHVAAEPYEIIGVLPDAFRFPEAEIYVPAFAVLSRRPRGDNYLSLVGRLRKGFSGDQLDAFLDAISRNLAMEHPGVHESLEARVIPLQQSLNLRVQQPLLILVVASLLVVSIGCANLLNLLIIRTLQRETEFAVRMAHGATPKDIVLLVLLESAAISVFAALGGVALATFGLKLLYSASPGSFPSHFSPQIELLTAGSVLAITLLVTSLISALPALSVTRLAAVSQARSARGPTSAMGSATRATLIVIEMSLALVLGSGAFSLVNQLVDLQGKELGVVASQLITAVVAFPADGGDAADPEKLAPEKRTENREQIFRQVDGVLRAIPGVRDVALADALPYSNINNISSSARIVGHAGSTSAGAAPRVQWRFASSSYIDTLGIPLLKGRFLEDADSRPGRLSTSIVVNEAFADRYLVGEPVGRIVSLGGEDRIVVGVTANARLFGLARSPVPEAYIHLDGLPSPIREFQVALRVQGDPSPYKGRLEETMRRNFPTLAVFELKTMEELVASGLLAKRFYAVLMSAFGALALSLALLGLYGVVASTVEERSHEVAVRICLGATPWDVVFMILSLMGKVLLAATLIGLAGSLGLHQLMKGKLFAGVDFSGIEFTWLVIAFAGISLVACLVPIRRVLKLQPNAVLGSL